MTTPATTFTGPDPCRMTAREAVAALKARKVSPTELVQAALARIEQVEPAVNASVTVCAERALAHAARIERDGGDWSAPGALAGLPITIKDLNPVAGVRTTWGTRALADFIADESDPLVERLEARGGVVLGKTNTPEMGAGGNTFNEVFGYTRNPWDTRLNAGGSSGGAAVSLATGECWLAHGSDLAGSLRTPAGYCAVVGLRPTPGRAGGGPAVAAFERDGISGPMARNVADCALFLDAMAGWDARTPIALDPPATPFAQAVAADPEHIRIAFAPTLGGFGEVEADVMDAMSAAMARAAEAGIAVDEACPDLSGLAETYVTIRGIHYGTVTDSAPAQVQAHFKQTLRANIEVGRNLTADAIYRALRHRSTLYHRMRVFLERFDVLACAVVGISPAPVEVEYPREVAGVKMRDYVEWLKFSYLATTTMLPALAMPCGFNAHGLPVGIQLIGPPRGEARLLQVAARLEEIWGIAPRLPIDPVVRHAPSST